MSDTMRFLTSFGVGAVLGVFFFGGLWWTILTGTQKKRPGLIFNLSLILRTGVTVAGFVFVSRGYIDQLLACMVGFIFARWIVMRSTRKLLDKKHLEDKELKHET